MLEILRKTESFLNASSRNIATAEVTQDGEQLMISFECSFKEQPPVKSEPETQIEMIEYVEDPEIAEIDEVFVGHDRSLSQQQWIENQIESNVTFTNEGRPMYGCYICDLKYFSKELAKNHLAYHFKNEDVYVGENEPSASLLPCEEIEDVKYFEEVSTQSEDEAQPAKKRKLNTLNDLNDDQIQWIRQEVAAGETTEGRRKAYKCTVCSIVLSTQASLTRHLRDVHILKTNQDSIDFKQEVISSKLTVDTKNGSETVWKCQRCENDRIYRSQQAFKLHLRMEHVRGTKVGTAFVAACKTMVVEASGQRSVWQCPDCERIFRHRDTLRNHIKLEHPQIDQDAARQKIQKKQESVSHDTSVRIGQKLDEKQAEKALTQCNECGLKFATSHHHMKPKVHKEAHETIKLLSAHLPRHKCASCRMLFNTEASLEDHLAVHLTKQQELIPAEGLAQFGAVFFKDPAGDADDAVDEAVWKCGHCSVRYFDENDCVTHIMLLHQSPINCFIDNREFKGSSGMSKYLQHLKNKHPELFPNLKYPCGGCKQEFATIYEKLAHQKFCSNKKFQCDYCGWLRSQPAAQSTNDFLLF